MAPRRSMSPTRAEKRRRPRPDRSDASCAKPHRAAVSWISCVPDMHCAGCLSKIERALRATPGVTAARANLTSHRVGVDFARTLDHPTACWPRSKRRLLRPPLRRCGARRRRRRQDRPRTPDSRHGGRGLCRRQHHAAVGVGMVRRRRCDARPLPLDLGDDRAAGHRLCRAAVLPLRLAGALRAGSINMDVPITLGVLLASAMSLFETAHARRARLVRRRDRCCCSSCSSGASSITGCATWRARRPHRLLSLAARGAMRARRATGEPIHVPIGEIGPGDRVRVAAGRARAGRRHGASSGASDIDRSLLTGESGAGAGRRPAKVFGRHAEPHGPAHVRVTARPEATLPRRDRPADGGGGAGRQPASSASPTALRGSMRPPCISSRPRPSSAGCGGRRLAPGADRRAWRC